MAVVGLVSCSEDVTERGLEEPASQPDMGIRVTVATNEISTRALTSFEADAADNELIHTCVVAFVDEESGKVAKVLDLPANSTGVDKQEFLVFLNEGTYRAYAFANFTDANLSSLNLKEDTELTLEDFEKLTMEVGADGLTLESLIPMSGYLKEIEVAKNGTVKLYGSAATVITIPVVRMVGKLEFQFSNDSSTDITITEISVKPKATGEVELLPTWKEFGKTVESPDITGMIFGDSITKTPSEFTIEGKDGEEIKTKNFAFYVREVVSNHPTGQFPIRIKYQKGNSGEEETMTALLYDLTEIKRNDWIRVPIKLTDYKLKLDVEFYPPIGGFPPVTTAEMEDVYYVTFGTGGWFGLYTTVVNKADGTEIAGKNVSIKIVDNGVSNTGFFRIQPRVESSGELTGEIKSGLESGAKSVVTIEVKVTDGDAVNTFKRKIHFIKAP